MDYDGSDTQGHNLQLAGEGKFKSSSVLTPCAFPRFDFDDSLQGHLRFDNHVETEGFLGIRSQEENQWIEDFSRGSNDIEFSSGATEPCSISRRHNVWSEAASSESVEMLLNSVGRDQIVPKDTVGENINTFNDLGTLTKNMEAKLEQGNVVSVDTRTSDTTIPQDELLNNFSTLEHQVSPSQPQLVQQHQSSNHMSPNVHGQECRASIAEGDILPGAECDNKSGKEAECPINESMDRIGEGPFRSAVPAEHINPSSSTRGSSQSPGQFHSHILEDTDVSVKVSGAGIKERVASAEIISCSSAMRDSSQSPDWVSGHSLEGTYVSVKVDGDGIKGQFASEEMGNADVEIMEQHMVEDGVHNKELSHSITLSADAVTKGTGVEGFVELDKSSAMSCAQESQFQLLEGRSNDCPLTLPTLPVTGQTDLLSISAVVNASSRGNVSFRDNSEHHAPVLETSNAEHHSCLAPMMDSMLQLDQELSSNKGGNVLESSHDEGGPANDVSGRLFKSFMIKGEDGRSTDNDSTASAVDVGESLGFLPLSSSVELTKEIFGAENVNAFCDASTGGVEGVSSRREDSEEARFHASNTGGSKDASVPIEKEQDIKLSTDKMSSETCGKDISVPMEKEQDIKLSADKMSSETCGVPSSDQRVGSSATMNSTSQDKTTADQLHSETAGKVESDDKQKSGDRMSSDADLSTLNESDQVAAEVGGNCLTQFGKCHDSTASHLSDIEVDVDCQTQSGKGCDSTAYQLSAVDTHNAVNASETHTANSSDCPKELEVHPDCGDSLKGTERSMSTADPEKVACGSPTIVSPYVLPPDERKQEDVGGSTENVPTTSEEPKVKDISADDNSFTFKVNSLPLVEREVKNWSLFPVEETLNSPLVSEATPKVGKIQAKLPRDSDSPREHTQGTSRATPGRRKRVSGKGASKEIPQSADKVMESTPNRHSHKGDKCLSVPLSPDRSLPGQFLGLTSLGLKEQKSKNQRTSTAIPISSLSDMSTSLKIPATSSAAFQPPFTYLQQVQLRAQIFVYGSLIQGAAPEGVDMVTAYGPSDRGRSLWEPLWQAAVERFRSKKSRSSGESPIYSLSSGVKVPDGAGKQVSHQSKVFPSPAGQAGNKGTPTTTLNPIIPFSSPLWSITTPYRGGLQSSNVQRRPIFDYPPAVSPLHLYQTPSVGNVSGQKAWQSQVTCSPSPWASQTSALNVTARFSSIPRTEPVRLTPLKEFSVVVPSAKDSASTPPVFTGSPSNVFLGSSPLSGQTEGTLSELPKPVADPKPRRRSKAQVPSDAPLNPLLSQGEREPEVASFPTSAQLVPVSIPTCRVTTSRANSFSASISQPLACHLGSGPSGTASTCLEVTSQNVADAKLLAEEAASLAGTAENHCLCLWNQLAKQECGMNREAELKVAAAAGAAAAAAAVAKAAAAAARIASNAALQAKLMADEALIPCGIGDGAQGGNLVFDVQNMGKAAPASVFELGGGEIKFSSVPVTAREAGKRRVEATSAAAKQAENLDAIIKVSELATEAVSRAGKIVAMSDPLPLKQLINAGPEGYWKLPQVSSELVIKPGNGNEEKVNVGSAGGSTKEHGGSSNAKGSEVLAHGMMPPQDLTNDTFDAEAGNTFFTTEPIIAGQKHPDIDKSHKVSDIVRSDAVYPVPECNSDSKTVLNEHELDIICKNDIREGSVIEVYKDDDGLKPAWFPANVLNLNDGEAFVHYNYLLSKEGSDNLKEWVILESEGDKAPRIRTALPMIGLHWQTRKRRRSAMGNFAWTIGDMVDVWIHNCWCEGVVTEKGEKGETTLTVHFPARGETSAVKAEQLRPSRVWRGGNWVEWTRLSRHEKSNESDLPLEKRPRLQSPLRSSDGKNKNLPDPVAGKPEESKFQALSDSEKVFNVGKSTKAPTRPDAQRTLRTGLQEEGSRVVFGIPRPGKKQKFMEVSKHFPAVQSRKDNEAKDLVKLAKYLMPRGVAGSRGLRNLSKVDSKGKRALNTTTSRKPHGTSSRTLANRDNSVNFPAAQHKEVRRLPGARFDKSVGHEENISNMKFMTDCGSSSNEFSNVDEKVYDSRNDRASAEASEPRRSNRRIQPTHRLLEGLQSSLVIPKMSFVSHSKGQGNKIRPKVALTRGKWL